MDCRHCGAGIRTAELTCPHCEVRLRPVEVVASDAPRCPDHPWVSSSRPGLYVLRFPAELRQGQMTELYDILADWWSKARTPVAWVLNYAAVASVEDWAARAEGFGDFARRVAPYADGNTICHAVVARDDFSRAALRTLFWRDKMKYPRRFFDTEADAQAWARANIA